MTSPATPPPDSTLGEDIDKLVRQLVIYGAGDLTIDEAVTEARTALLARFEAFGKEVIGEDEKGITSAGEFLPDATSTYQDTRNQLKADQRTRLAHLLQGKGE